MRPAVQPRLAAQDAPADARRRRRLLRLLRGRRGRALRLPAGRRRREASVGADRPAVLRVQEALLLGRSPADPCPEPAPALRETALRPRAETTRPGGPGGADLKKAEDCREAGRNRNGKKGNATGGIGEPDLSQPSVGSDQAD